MNSDLFVLFDILNDNVLEGPRLLPSNLIHATMGELNSLGWYLALPIEYDIGNYFDENAFNRTSLDFIYTDTPYPAIRRYVTTSPRNIDVVKQYVVLKLTEYRNWLFDQGFIYGGYLFDADELARLNWTASVASMTTLGYMHNVPYANLDSVLPTQEWTRRDNLEAAFKPTEIITCGLKLGNWASDCFKYCRARKTTALNAETFEDVWAIWTSNDISLWPNRNLGGVLALPQP